MADRKAGPTRSDDAMEQSSQSHGWQGTTEDYAASQGYVRDSGGGWVFTGGRSTAGGSASVSTGLWGEQVVSGLSNYGGGGGYGEAEATEQDEKAGRILAAIVNENKNILKDTWANMMHNYDVADEQSQRIAAANRCQVRRHAGAEWYLRQQGLQSVAIQLRREAGNALLSSLFYDMRQMLARQDDIDDSEVLMTLRENLQTIEDNLFEALSDNQNNRNEVTTTAEQQLRQLVTDLAAQLNNIHPDLLDDLVPGGVTIIDGEDDVPADVIAPDWMSEVKTWYSDHVFDALEAVNVKQIRPGNAAQVAYDGGLLLISNESEGAFDASYWTQVQDESIRRTQ